MMVVVLVIN